MKLEKIYWKDICGISSHEFGWSGKETMVAEARRLFDLDYITVGYVIYEDKDFLVVAASKDMELGDPMYHDASMIMKSVITKREELYDLNGVPA